MSTIVKATCVSKKTEQSYYEENPVKTTIELEVPYDPKSIYYKLSGGSNFELHTINQAAADMFELGKSYDVIIQETKDEN